MVSGRNEETPEEPRTNKESHPLSFALDMLNLAQAAEYTLSDRLGIFLRKGRWPFFPCQLDGVRPNQGFKNLLESQLETESCR